MDWRLKAANSRNLFVVFVVGFRADLIGESVRLRVTYGVSRGPPTQTLTANHRRIVAPYPLRPAFLPASTSSLLVQAYVGLLPSLLIFMQTQELLLEKLFQEPSVVSTTTTTNASDTQSDLRCVVCDAEFDTQFNKPLLLPRRHYAVCVNCGPNVQEDMCPVDSLHEALATNPPLDQAKMDELLRTGRTGPVPLLR